MCPLSKLVQVRLVDPLERTSDFTDEVLGRYRVITHARPKDILPRILFAARATGETAFPDVGHIWSINDSALLISGIS